MTNGVRRSGVLLFAWATTAAPLLAQHPEEPARIPYAELVANHKLGKQPFDTKWIVKPDGTLTQLPNPAAGGSTNRGFPFVNAGPPVQKGQDPAAKSLSRRTNDWDRAASWLAPLLRHPGDMLGATNAQYHFHKLGQIHGTESLRQFLLQPGTATGDAMVRRELLDRELAIRLLVERGARSARGEILALAKRTDDAFLRHTAQRALATFGAGKAPDTIALANLPILAPGIADLWVWIDTTKLQPRHDIATATREAHDEWMWQMLLSRGRDLSELNLAGGQFIIDLPEELPFELTRVWGRTRIDQCLLAFKLSEGDVIRAWAAASGGFETTVLDDYLSRTNVLHTMKDGVVSSDTWWRDYQIQVAPDHIIVCHKDSVRATKRAWPPVVNAAKNANAALAFEVSRGSLLKHLPWLPRLDSPIATLAASPFSISITSRDDEADAKNACQIYAKLLGEHISKRLPDAGPKWRDAFLKARITPGEKTGAHIDVGDSELDLWQLWPLLLK